MAHDTSKNFRRLCAAALMSFLLAAPATALGGPASAPGDAIDFPPGYDWARRVNATHLVADATMHSAIVDATRVRTPYIDLEITGLMPHRSYELRLGTLHRHVHADEAGHGVGWNILAESGTWILSDMRSGEPVTVFTIRGPPLGDAVSPNHHNPHHITICDRECAARHRSPEPTWSSISDGYAIEQAAYSFTPAFRIVASKCYAHEVVIDARVSGGMAAQAGGVSRKWLSSHCMGIGAPPGRSVEVSRQYSVMNETYEDGSWRVIPTAQYEVWSYEEFDSTRSAWKPWDPGRGQSARTMMLTGLTETREVLRLAETAAGSVYYENGLSVFGTGLGVSFRAHGGGSQDNWLAFEAQPGLDGTYKLDTVAGTGDSGLVGVAWRAK